MKTAQLPRLGVLGMLFLIAPLLAGTLSYVFRGSCTEAGCESAIVLEVDGVQTSAKKIEAQIDGRPLSRRNVDQGSRRDVHL